MQPPRAWARALRCEKPLTHFSSETSRTSLLIEIPGAEKRDLKVLNRIFDYHMANRPYQKFTRYAILANLFGTVAAVLIFRPEQISVGAILMFGIVFPLFTFSGSLLEHLCTIHHALKNKGSLMRLMAKNNFYPELLAQTKAFPKKFLARNPSYVFFIRIPFLKIFYRNTLHTENLRDPDLLCEKVKNFINMIVEVGEEDF